MPCPSPMCLGDQSPSSRNAVKWGTVGSRNTRIDPSTHLDIFIFAHNLDGQRNTFQRNTKNLGYRKWIHVFLLLPRVHLVAHPRFCAARSSSTLSRSGTGYPLLSQRRKSRVRVVVCFLDFPPVNDIDHVVDSDGRLWGAVSDTCDLRLWKPLASATFVAAMIFHFFDGLKTARCSPLVRFA